MNTKTKTESKRTKARQTISINTNEEHRQETNPRKEMTLAKDPYKPIKETVGIKRKVERKPT
jgi:hypothetical protein